MTRYNREINLAVSFFLSVRVLKLSHSIHSVFIALETGEWNATHSDVCRLFPRCWLPPQRSQRSRNANVQTLVPRERGQAAAPATETGPDRTAAAST